MRNDWGWQNRDDASSGGPPIRQLMRAGQWLVPANERPKLAPPPREESRQAYMILRSHIQVGEANR